MKRISLLVMVLGGVLGYALYFANSPMPLLQTPLQFSLKPGSSLKSAALQMRQAGAIADEASFVRLGRLLGKTRQIKFGNYQLDKPVSRLELLDMISSGKSSQSQITFVEGLTFREMRAVMDAHPDLKHDSSSLTERALLQRIGATEAAAEGLFFPDTYNFSGGSSDLRVLQRAYQLMQQNLAQAWAQRDSDLPLASPYEALILASIVEKETGREADRTLIAAVFINRLRLGMRLQTDPTVIYGLGARFDGNLRKRDLIADTPYNTYARSGLPPTPIAQPGLKSLWAVTHPAKSRALYFVARGDGSSEFSDSLTAHNKAVRKYQLKQ
ncbi:endolytic transglycosylase MltG [Ferrigenium sp. UT4]